MSGRYGHVRDAILKEAGGIDDAVDTMLLQFESFIDKQGKESKRAATGPSGAILSGIPGSGKSKLALLFAQNAGIGYNVVNCPELFHANQGQSEAQLVKTFAAPKDKDKDKDKGSSSNGGHGPARILVLEEIDVLSGSGRPGTMEARIFSLLLKCIDSNKDVFVVATTSRIEAVPEEIRRPGRLDMVIDIYFADAAARAAALSIMLRKFDSVSSADDDIARIAKAAHGFSAADLQSLCLRTFMEHRYKTTADDLVHMVSEVKPSNLSSFQSKIPPVRFADMFGIDDTISLVRSVVIEPLMNAEKYHEMQVEPPRGALIYGPPGTGKSMLCCAVANELSVNAIWVDSTQLRSMVVGESEKAIADLFAQARKSAPCILLFDNIDTLAPKRGTSQTSENTSDRIVTSLLVEMDGYNVHANRQQLSPSVFVLAVTNRPHVVDPALLRPGRLDVKVGLSCPDEKGRKAILSGYMRKSPATAKIYTNGTFVDKLVSMTRGYSGAELANLCREAAMTALRRDIESVEVTEADFEQCLEADLR